MLEVESVCVDISRVGRVLDDVTMSAEPGVTAVSYTHLTLPTIYSV